MRTAAAELDAVEYFDVVVVNDDLDEAVETVRAGVLEGAPGVEPEERDRRVAGLRAELARTLNERT